MSLSPPSTRWLRRKKMATSDLESIMEELDYLRFFHAEADFGPADWDVRDHLDKQYKKETGGPLPDGY